MAGVRSPSTRAELPLKRRRLFLIFAVVSLGLLMVSLDQTIVATALTSIQRDTESSISWSSWTITIYALGQVLVMPAAGALSDQLGRKRVFLSAVAIFTLASLLCGLADNIYLLVLFRALQACGGGAFIPSATGIIADHFGADRDRAIGLFASIIPIGAILGPVVGALIVTHLSWSWIFFINIPLGILLFATVAWLVPSSRVLKPGRLDWRGLILMATAMIAIMAAAGLYGSSSVNPVVPLLLLLAAPVVAIYFVRRCRSVDFPLVPIRLLTGRGFAAVNIINLTFGAAAFGFAALAPLYAESRYGFSPVDAGTMLLARGVGMIAVSAAATFALRRTGYRLPMVAGFSIVAIGLTMTAIAVPPGVSVSLWLLISAVVIGIGQGLAIPATNNAMLAMEPGSSASLAGLRGMFRQSGGIVCVALLTAVLAQSSNPGLALAQGFGCIAICIVVMIPLVFRVPEHRGAW